MILVTTQTQVASIVRRWQRAYPKNVILNDGRSTDDIAATLSSLSPLTTIEEVVTAIIGNDSWTALRCDECGRKVNVVVIIGGAVDQHSQHICRECLSEALKLMEQGT
jgi:hypothetical protein